MQAFLEYVVKGLVQNPEAVTITPVEREGTRFMSCVCIRRTWERSLAGRA